MYTVLTTIIIFSYYLKYSRITKIEKIILSFIEEDTNKMR